MKKVILCVAMSALILSVSAVSAENKSTSVVEKFVVDGVSSETNVQYCKEGTFEDNCYYWRDGCCNMNFRDTDPDCQSGPSFRGGDSVIRS